MHLVDLPSNFHAPSDVLSTLVNFPCSWLSFRQLCVRKGRFPSTSDNTPYRQKAVNFYFHQLSVHLGNLLPISINFPCSRETCHQLLTDCHATVIHSSTSFTFCAAGRPSVYFRPLTLRPGEPSSTSVSIPFWRDTCCQLPSTFREFGRPSINFRELFVQTEDLPSASVGLPCARQNFCLLPSTFHSAGRPSFNLHEISVYTGDILSTSINLPCT